MEAHAGPLTLGTEPMQTFACHHLRLWEFTCASVLLCLLSGSSLDTGSEAGVSGRRIINTHRLLFGYKPTGHFLRLKVVFSFSQLEAECTFAHSLSLGWGLNTLVHSLSHRHALTVLFFFFHTLSHTYLTFSLSLTPHSSHILSLLTLSLITAKSNSKE